MAAREGPQRLLPKIIDFNAEAHPTKLYAIFPKSELLSDGFYEFTYKQFADSINHISWWLDESLGKSQSFDTIAYIGPKDIRYSILAVAAIKTHRKVLFPSPFSSTKGFRSLLDATKCTAIFCPAPVSSTPLVERFRNTSPGLDILYVPDLTEWLFPQAPSLYPYDKNFEVAEKDTFMILHTSGTTGTPKPLFYTNGSIACYDAQRYMPEEDGPMWWHLITGKKIFSPMPTLHVAGIFATLILPIFFDATVVLAPGSAPLTVDLVNQIHDLEILEGGLYPPSILEEICKSEEALLKISKLKFVMFTGAPLSETAGQILGKSVKLHNTIGSTEVGVFPVFQTSNSEWVWFKFHPYFGYYMEPRGEGRHELIVRRDPRLSAFQSIFHLYSDTAEYRTRDLFIQHPVKPDYWRYQGRVDDLIILSHGEDLDPIPLEAIVRQNRLVSGAVIGGEGRSRPFLLCELKESELHSKKTQSQIIQEISREISEANTKCSEYVQLTKDLVLFTAPPKPLRRTLKGSIDRRGSLEDYKSEIDRLYSELEI
ncbi:acetyl-CoA synthetase-like protein [Stipitochalara longipes BDJ]|nr:acetyl-CoA synthetase-like protein [Stipitochalara longipes BDJ]